MSHDEDGPGGGAGAAERLGGEDPRSDAELIARLRGRGADRDSSDAFATLYARHQQAAHALARQLARSPADADDLVAGAFTRMLEVLRAGRGPTEAFRAYLLTSVRHQAYDRTRAERRLDLTDDIADVHGIDPDGMIVPFTDPALAGLERTLAARAFSTLPERWQAVLWHLEVEGDTPADIAPLFGLTANAVSALGYRAREGLRQAYLQEHLAAGSGRWDRRHRDTGAKLGAYTRGGLARRESQRVEAHLAECAECRALAAELRDVNAGMIRSVVAPLVLGAGLMGYLASRGSAGPLAFDATTGELAVAGGGALGVLGALTGLTGAPRPAAPHRIGVAGALSIAGVVGLAGLGLGDVIDSPTAPPDLAAPPMALVPPGSQAAPPTPVPRPGPDAPVPTRPAPALPAPSLPAPPLPAPALAVPDLAGPGVGEAGSDRGAGRRGTSAGTSAGATRTAAGSAGSSTAVSPARSSGTSPSGTSPSGTSPSGTSSAGTSSAGPSSAGTSSAGPSARSAGGASAPPGGSDTRARPVASPDRGSAVVVLDPGGRRTAARDCAVTTRLPVLGSAGLVCPTGGADRGASVESRR